MMTSSRRLIAIFTGHRFAIMLASLLALLLVAPLFGSDPKSEAEVAMIFSVVVAVEVVVANTFDYQSATVVCVRVDNPNAKLYRCIVILYAAVPISNCMGKPVNVC